MINMVLKEKRVLFYSDNKKVSHNRALSPNDVHISQKDEKGNYITE
jgi:hypothetical protein